MDKKFLKEHNLLEAQKHFMRLCEWSYVPSNINEDDEDDDMVDNNAPNVDQSQQSDDNMGANQPAQGGDIPPMGGNDMPQDNNGGMPQDGGMPQGDEMPPMGDEGMPQGGGMDQGLPQGGDDMPPMDDMPMDDMGSDDEVIDVDDLTDAQETMNDKVNIVGQDLGQVDQKIVQLLSKLSSMEKMIDSNNQEIKNFKQEFEKRNPTQTEKLNLRSLDSYPFNVSPQDYWAKKSTDPNSNYSGYADNSEPTTQEYQITNNDVDDFNEREIENSFEVDDELQQDLRKIFGF